MPKFVFSDSLRRVSAAAGIAHDNAENTAEQFAKDYPDADEFKVKYMEWIRLNASNQLTPEHLLELGTIIVRDVATGVFTPDPKAFTGGV